MPLAATAASPAAGWPRRLEAALETIDARSPADLGVYVRDLDTGESVSHRARELWYLASTVKLPIAIAVLTDVQNGRYALSTPVTLRATDYVDGAGSTNSRPVGSTLRVDALLEQMMVHSDNTASDMLIGMTGLAPIRALVEAQVPGGFQPITTLADVRRQVYGQLTPAAAHLSGQDFLAIKHAGSDAERRRVLSQIVHVPVARFRLASVNDAYDAYYATGVNAGRLDAYGELLARLAQGQLLDAQHTRWLLDLMGRAKTGRQRIQAGLPPGTRFAHKTGTQRARTCDSGVIMLPRLGRDRQLVVAACTRGESSLAEAELLLRQVGAALCRTGALDATAASHEDLCHVDAQLGPARGPAALPGADRRVQPD